MKINVDGITREMTREEIEEAQALALTCPGEPTAEELQAQITELQQALNLLLSGETQ